MRLRVKARDWAEFVWECSETRFRIGRAAVCALRFEGPAAEFVSGEHVEFTEAGDGFAFVTDLRSSNGTYVDGVRINQPTPVRKGTVIQLGRTGARLEVLELNVGPRSSTPVPISPATIKSAKSQLSASEEAASVWSDPRLRPIIIGSGGFGLVLLTLVIWSLLRSGSPEIAEPANPPATVEPAAEHKATEAPKSGPPPSGEAAAPKVEIIGLAPTAQEQNTARARRMLLVVVEDPKTHASWPFATACVVGEKVALTTAGVAQSLEKFRKDGWQISVSFDPQRSRVKIDRFVEHAGYKQTNESEQLYFDMALLFAAESLGEAAELTPAASLDALETGVPLNLVAIEYGSDPIDRFQQFELRSFPCKVFAVTKLAPQPGAPRLLHLRGSLPERAAGSPLVDEQGRLVAIYCEPAPPSGDGKLSVHYAKVIEPQLLDLGVSGRDAKIWVSP